MFTVEELELAVEFLPFKKASGYDVITLEIV